MTRLSLSVSLAALVGCSPSIGPTQGPAGTSSASGAPSSSALPASPPKSAFEVALAKLGTVTPVPVLSPSLDSDTAGVVTSQGVVQSLWLHRKDGSIERAADYPFGTKLMGATEIRLAPDKVASALLLESLRSHDQPEGIRGVWMLGESLGDLDNAAFAVAFEKAATVDDARRVPAPSGAPSEKAISRTLALMTDEKRVHEALSKGVDAFALAQGLFLVRERHLDDASATAADAKAMYEILAEARKGNRCVGLVCEGWAGEGEPWAAVVFEPVAEGATEAKIRGFFGLRVDAPARGVGKVVAADANGKATDEILSSRALEPMRVLAQAPLSAAGGTIGIAIAEKAQMTPFVVFSDGAAAGDAPLESFSMLSIDVDVEGKALPPPVYDVRFADVDGDGRTEAIVRRATKPNSYPPGDFVLTEIVRAPSLRGAELPRSPQNLRHLGDLARAKKLDDAVAAVVGMEPVDVDEKDACALMRKLGTKAGLAAASTSDAVVFEFYEPYQPEYYPVDSVKPLAGVDLTRLPSAAQLGATCGELRCEDDVCALREEPPGSTFYWFRKEKGALKVSGVAIYSGS